jgi:hypothetical protein
MEQTNSNPKKATKITDQTLIDYFKQRHGITTNAERLVRIIPNYNKLFNTNIPNTKEGTAELRGILTGDYLQSIQPPPIPQPPPQPKKSKAQLEAERQREVDEWNKQQLEKIQKQVSVDLQQIIKADEDVAITFSFEEITELYQYSIAEFIDLFLDYNPQTEAPQDRIIILSVYSPDNTTPEHIFLLTRQGANNLYSFLRGNNQYSQDSSENMERLFSSFNEGFTFKIENRKRIKGMKGLRKEGEFFNYLHKTQIDLTKCGIFNNNQNQQILDEGIQTYDYDLLSNKGCLYYALHQNLLTDHLTPYIVEDLHICFTNIHRTSLKISSVEYVAKELKITINLTYNDGFKNRKVKLNDGCKYECNIGFLADHYFLNYKTQHTIYSVNNYFEVCDVKDYNYIYARKPSSKDTTPKYQRDNTGGRFVNAYDVVECFLKNKEVFLEDLPSIIEKSNGEVDKQTKATAITEEQLATAVFKIDEDQIYNYEDDVAKRLESLEKRIAKDKSLSKEWVNVACDLETNTDKTTNKILAIGSFFKLPNQPPKRFIGSDCIQQLLKALPNNGILYFHNTKFDISHFHQYFTDILEYVENAGRFIYQKAKYYGKTFYIIDTLNYLSGSLKSLAEDFKLKMGKELINYQIYNDLTHASLSCGKWYRNIDDDFKNHYDSDEVFLENIERWKLKRSSNKQEYDALGYLSEYGLIDVVILQQLYEVFVKSVFDNFGIDMLFGLNNGYKLYPTISSVAREFSKKTGCLNGVCSNQGVIREFIDGALVGGRTMLKANEKVIVKTVGQSIIDYTSLYPSAMYRMGKYPIGKPIFIRDLSGIGENYYIVKIRIGRGGVSRPLNYPVISKITKRYMMDIDGKMKNINTRCFTNDFTFGEELIVDKYTLEDVIEFQGLDYSVMYGLGWLGGYNTTIKDIVKFCFDKRIELKRAGNTAGQTAYKLILNSLYGFTAEKPHLTKINIVNHDDVMKYVLSHSKRVCSASKIGGGDKYLVKSGEDINKHSNYNHIATGILSYSKRLMNEVFVVAEDNGVSVEYTDTDSIFLKSEDLELLDTKYVEKYSRELINNAGVLNTFKLDMDGFVVREGDKYVKTNCKAQGISSEDLIGGEGIYLGKKTYLVEVKNKKDVNFTGYIFSSKGITDTSLFHYCNKRQTELGVNYGLKDLFVGLSNNEYVEIDLCEDGSKYRVEYVNTASFQKKNFTRRIGGFRELEFVK